jgi:hypothetical protein
VQWQQEEMFLFPWRFTIARSLRERAMVTTTQRDHPCAAYEPFVSQHHTHGRRAIIEANQSGFFAFKELTRPRW